MHNSGDSRREIAEVRRHCEEQRDEAIHSFLARRDGLLRFARNDVKSKYASAISRRDAPEFFMKSIRPEKSEGAGNAGCPMHPQPRVQMKKAHERSHHGHTGTTRHSPRKGEYGRKKHR